MEEKKDKKVEIKKEKRHARKLNWERIALWVILAGAIVFLTIKGYASVAKIVTVRQELWFAYTHPEFVKPVQKIYEASHGKVDSDLQAVLNLK